MRKLILTAVVVGLFVLPMLAQPGFFGGRGQGGDTLLLNKSVQDELKLTDAQKKDLGDISKAQQEQTRKMFEAFKEGEREKATEIGKKMREDQTKRLAKVKKSLTSSQAKRFQEIEIQIAVRGNSAEVFKNPTVQEGLKLTTSRRMRSRRH